MFRVRSAKLAAASVAAWMVCASGNVARADNTDACLAAYEKSQQLKQQGKLGASREQLVQCVQPTCPALVKKDCSQWLADLDASTPTVIVNARDAEGKDVLNVRVLVDGAVLMDKLDGKPHPIDPGVHVFRYEREGADPTEESIVIQEHEKNRVITAKIALPPASSTSPSMHLDTTAPPPSSPVLGYTLLGVGVAGVAVFSIFAAMGQHDVDQMRNGPDKCAPSCDPSRVDSARTKIIVANASLGAGIVAAGVGTFLLLKPSKSSTGLGVGVRPVAGGTMADVRVGF
jgi:hypothetical protein